MTDIIISEFMDVDAVNDMSRDYHVHYDPELVDHTDELKSRLANARALVVRNRTRVTAELLDAAPHLEVVGRLGVGLDNIDLKACEQRNITVCPATGANDAAVAEWVIVCVMALLRGAFAFRSQMLDGQWPRNQAMGREAAGKTLGLVGFGQIARETAKRARALGLLVAAYDPFVSVDDPCWEGCARVEALHELLGMSDAISLHVPLNHATHHLIDGEAIAGMKRGAVLINAARGGVVDEKAMADAMTSGHLAGAALDVYETEPLTREAAKQLADLPNLILTPHIGGVTIESNQRVSRVTMDNVRRVLEGGK